MKIRAEIFIAMNEDGAFEVGIDEEEASSRLLDGAGGSRTRIVKITASITPPKIAEATIDVADETEQEIEAAA